MSKIRIVLENLPAMPRNRSHQLMKGKLIKTKLARMFDADLKERLDDYRELFDAFFAQYDRKAHAIRFILTVLTPSNILFTKVGTISENSTDGDAHKALVDGVSTALGIDDSQFCDWLVYKRTSPNDQWHFVVEIETFFKEALSNDDLTLH